MNELMKAPPAVGAINVAQAQTPVVNFFDPAQFEIMQRVCKLFASSELVPDMYKASEKNPMEKAVANCMIAIEVANRIGASPLMVMQNMVGDLSNRHGKRVRSLRSIKVPLHRERHAWHG